MKKMEMVKTAWGLLCSFSHTFELVVKFVFIFGKGVFFFAEFFVQKLREWSVDRSRFAGCCGRLTYPVWVYKESCY